MNNNNNNNNNSNSEPTKTDTSSSSLILPKIRSSSVSKSTQKLQDQEQEQGHEQQELSASTSNPTRSTKGWIVQSYLQSPLLIHGRKFDIRCYVLLFLCNGVFRAYYYPEGYIRTSSKKYNLKSLHDREIHLTNDAIQKKSKLYGKHENGNKLSYEELEEIIAESLLKNNNNTNSNNNRSSNNDTRNTEQELPETSNLPQENIFHLHVLPQIKQQIIYSLKSTKEKLSNSSIKYSFELLGYDFMVDSSFKSYLIEINSNPCLEFSCPMLERLISSVIEGVFQVTVDTVYPPPLSRHNTNEINHRFEELNLND